MRLTNDDEILIVMTYLSKWRYVYNIYGRVEVDTNLVALRSQTGEFTTDLHLSYEGYSF